MILEKVESVATSPAMHKQEVKKNKIKNAEQALHDDQTVQKIQQEFSAELIKKSITSLEDDL